MNRVPSTIEGIKENIKKMEKLKSKEHTHNKLGIPTIRCENNASKNI